MKKSVSSNRIPSIKRQVKKYTNEDLEYLTQGKTIEQIAKNSATYEKFKYRAKFLSEKESRRKTLEKMEKKSEARKEREIKTGIEKAKKQVKKQLDIIKNKYSAEDYRIITRVEGILPTFQGVDSPKKLRQLNREVKELNILETMEDIVKKDAEDTLKERYFKVFQNAVEKEERLDAIIEKLGGRMGTFNELVDHITGESFKGSDYDKKGMYRSADEQYEVMTDRLDRIERWVEVNT